MISAGSLLTVLVSREVGAWGAQTFGEGQVGRRFHVVFAHGGDAVGVHPGFDDEGPAGEADEGTQEGVGAGQEARGHVGGFPCCVEGEWVVRSVARFELSVVCGMYFGRQRRWFMPRLDAYPT